MPWPEALAFRSELLRASMIAVGLLLGIVGAIEYLEGAPRIVILLILIKYKKEILTD